MDERGKEFIPPESSEFVDSKKAEESRQIEAKIRADFGKVFDSAADGQGRVELLLVKLKPILDADVLGRDLIDEEAVQKILAEVAQCSAIDDREQFIVKTSAIVKPIIDLRVSHPQEFEKMKRVAFVKEGGFIPLNEILSYEFDEGIIYLHLAQAKELIKSSGVKNVLDLITDGLEKLSEVVKEDESIKKIVATSWIVAQSPKILERLGFTIEGEIDEEAKVRHFVGETRPVSRASMTRGEFLAKYLKL